MPARISTAGLKFPKPRKREKRQRPGNDAGHLKNVRLLPCVFYGSGTCMGPVQAHHSLDGEGRGMGRRAADKDAGPLCMEHHARLHATGDEARYCSERGVDFLAVAQALWRRRGDYAAMKLVIERARV